MHRTRFSNIRAANGASVQKEYFKSIVKSPSERLILLILALPKSKDCGNWGTREIAAAAGIHKHAPSRRRPAFALIHRYNGPLAKAVLPLR